MRTFGQFLQLAYATNDFDRALDEFRKRHGVQRFLEMRNISSPTLAGRHAQVHVALAWASDSTQIEIIAPLSGDDSLYRDALDDAGYCIRLHHVGQLAASRADFEDYREKSIAEGVPLVVDTPYYFYIDTRPTLGHCIEYIIAPDAMSPEMLDMRDRIPRN